MVVTAGLWAHRLGRQPCALLGSSPKCRGLRTKPKFLAACSWRALSFLSAGGMDRHPTLCTPTPSQACPWPPGRCLWLCALGSEAQAVLLLNRPYGAAPHPVCPWLSPSICPFSRPRTHCSSASPATCPSIHSPIHPTIFSLSQWSAHPPVHLPASSSECPHLLTHPSTCPSVSLSTQNCISLFILVLLCNSVWP